MKYVFIGCAYLKGYADTVETVVYDVFTSQNAAKKWLKYCNIRLKGDEVIQYFYERREIRTLKSMTWMNDVIKKGE